MIVFKKTKTLTKHLQQLQSKTSSVGFVPTMGALHNGHISLIKAAKKQSDIVVCSVFINPTQFNNKLDFEKYPVTIENDILLLEQNETDILFLPSVEEIYLDGTVNLKHFDLGDLENILEGFYRPSHFQGVCNVVYRLLNIVRPDLAFFGQKDFQQVMVVKKMMKNYYPEMKLFVVETMRENDGLAMSSRNMRLDKDDRKKATAIYHALQYIKQNIQSKNFDELKTEATKNILQNGFDKVDYVEICDAENLQPLHVFDPNKKMVVLAAAFLNDVRLIDNLLL